MRPLFAGGVQAPEDAERIAKLAVAVAPEHQFDRHNDFGAGRHRALPPEIDIVDDQLDGEAFMAFEGVSVLGIGIRQHQGAAVDVEMNMHRPAALIDRYPMGLFGAEGPLVEFRGLHRAVDRQIGQQAILDRRQLGRIVFRRRIHAYPPSCSSAG
ncbi:hypothetical protein RHECNPAF_3340089 [Rhizobium etli CNPAF512]|nr:hypothetical protein RHECNPAF_3340089 [Rhizobium etli CNPAF512]